MIIFLPGPVCAFIYRIECITAVVLLGPFPQRRRCLEVLNRLIEQRLDHLIWEGEVYGCIPLTGGVNRLHIREKSLEKGDNESSTYPFGGEIECSDVITEYHSRGLASLFIRLTPLLSR